MTLKKLLLIVAGGLGILGAVLPWYRVSFFGYSATTNAFEMGMPYVLFAILAILVGVASILLMVLSEKQIKNIIKLKDLSKLPLFCGIAQLAIAVLSFIIATSQAHGVGNVSWGVWLMGLGGVAAIVIPFLKNVKQLDMEVIKTSSSAAKSTKAEKTEKSDKKDTKKSSK